jgi:hypothetical protein
LACAKRRRLGIGLLVAIAAGALSFGLEAADEEVRPETGTVPSEAAQPATREMRPIPEPGPLAQPKSLDQVSLPAELTRRAIPPDNPQTPEEQAALAIVNPIEMGQPGMDAGWPGSQRSGSTNRPFTRSSASRPMAPIWCGQSRPTSGRRFRSVRRLITLLRAIGAPSMIRQSAAGAFQHPGLLQ